MKYKNFVKISKNKFFLMIQRSDYTLKAAKHYDSLSVRIVVTKKQGNAVSRNKIKRRIRECVHHQFVKNKALAGLNMSVVIIPYMSVISGEFTDIGRQIELSFKKILEL